MIGGKMMGLDKSYNEEQGSNISDDLSFYDLHDIKDDFTFETDENMYHINELMTKELEKETM
jgi:hypothetical protein